MVNAISSMIRMIAGRLTETAGNNRFWAVVLQAEGEHALLEFRGERLVARLETAVKAGEKLLLEQVRVVDGQVHCKVLHRLPQSEPAALFPEGPFMLWHPVDKQVMPYLLAAAKEEGNSPVAAGQKTWRFTLYTGTLGAVTLIAAKNDERCEISIVVENVKVAEQLAHLSGAFTSDDAYTPVIRGIRVKHPAEVVRTEESMGGQIDRLL